jgi:hypothetical protein
VARWPSRPACTVALAWRMALNVQTGASFSAQLLEAGEPSSLPENCHYELALIVVVRRIDLFELIEHSVNFSLSGTLRTHFRYFEFEACQL